MSNRSRSWDVKSSASSAQLIDLSEWWYLPSNTEDRSTLRPSASGQHRTAADEDRQDVDPHAPIIIPG